MRLFDPGRHEALAGAAWDESAARAAISQIVADTQVAFTEDGLWPIHPLDVSPERPPDCMKPLYHGAAGVIWALRRLGPAAGDLPAVTGLAERMRDDLQRHEGVRDYMATEQSAFMVGVTGVLLLQWTMAPSPDLETALRTAIDARRGDPRGVVWGGAGALLAAVFMAERIGTPVWRSLVRDHAQALWAASSWSDDLRCRLWTQDLYGETARRLGALHGFAANVLALLRAGPLLATDLRSEIEAESVAALKATALRDGTLANWPMTAGVHDGPPLVQHCMGAPGMINAFAGLPAAPDLDALLLGAGELTWRAGPAAKLPGLCHGAPGAGYAFLKLHRRTGDGEWLARARRFAMHAIRQAERARDHYGQRKFSLWTGDLGLALFLQDCIDGAAGFPTLDVF